MRGGQATIALFEGALKEEGGAGARLRPLMGAFMAIFGSNPLHKIGQKLQRRRDFGDLGFLWRREAIILRVNGAEDRRSLSRVVNGSDRSDRSTCGSIISLLPESLDICNFCNTKGLFVSLQNVASRKS